MANLPSDLTLTILPTSKSYKARVLENNMGDGYTQRVQDGINNITREVNVELVGTATQIKTYTDFFELCGGATNFTWTPPGETTSLKWTCQEWNVGYLSSTILNLTAKFRKEFDL